MRYCSFDRLNLVSFIKIISNEIKAINTKYFSCKVLGKMLNKMIIFLSNLMNTSIRTISLKI